jgi:hypothetical protein
MQLTPTAQPTLGQALLGAALGLAALPIEAASAPEATVLSLHYLDYRENSAEGERMQVREPVLYLHAPLDERLSVESTLVVDSLSGASPEFHNTLSGASGKGVRDLRRAGDIKLRYYGDRTTFALGLAASSENDYDSHALSTELQVHSADQNSTLTLGWARTLDAIGSGRDATLDAKRQSRETLLGFTQVLSPVALVQSNLSYKSSHGFHNDPYKAADRRPDSRHQLAWLTRYHHHFPALDTTLKLDYRLFRDNWQVRAHTVGVGASLPLAMHWRLEPQLRAYSQSAVYFYNDQFPLRRFPSLYSTDHRLGAFGALSAGLKLSYKVDTATTLDLSVERYRQQAGWHWGGAGSPSLNPMNARALVIGITHEFR